MFLMGELLTVDNYRKGLEHFHKENRAKWSLPSGTSDFYIDYARNEIVLMAEGGADPPLEVRRSLVDFVCK
jgi:hypothetical protein